MLPNHEYPVPQRERLIGIIRYRRVIAVCPTATLADAAITSAVLRLPQRLTTDPVSVWHAVERLGKAIHDEHAEQREGEDWGLAKVYVRSVPHRMT